MTRAELTVANMKERGWEEMVRGEEPLIKDIVFCIKEYAYPYLRCTKDLSERKTEREYGMCSTYDVTYVREYLEYSLDNKTWFKVAKRFVEYSSRCVYAD